MSPRSVSDVGPAVVALGDAIGADVPASLEPPQWGRWLDEQRAAAPSARRRSAVLVWRRPWMTTNAYTYGSSLLELLGVDNVCGGAVERYPETTLEEI